MSATPAPAASTVDTDALRVALQRILADRRSPGARIASLARRPSAYGSSFPLDELDLVLDDGTEHALMFKDLGPRAMSEAARGARPPEHVHEPMREIEAYRRVLGPAGLSTAELFGFATEQAVGRFWLFLERVPGVGLDQVGSVEVWCEAAAWLGRMHRHFAGRVAELEAVPHLVRYDAPRLAGWARHAVDIAARTRPRADARTVESVAPRYLATIERLAAMPRTFLHGDCYATNVLVDERTNPPRVCPVDWELCGVGPHLLDLAALVAGDWPDEPRGAIVGEYRRTFDPDGAVDPDRFQDDLGLCSLALAMRCLARSPEWPAPPQHARDWVAEAALLADRIGAR